jgi:hypothetical protein
MRRAARRRIQAALPLHGVPASNRAWQGSVFESDYQMLPDPRLRMLSKLPLPAETFTRPDWAVLP